LFFCTSSYLCNQMVNGRQKGHAFERRLAQTFREKGWEKCLTSRLESKLRDDEKVDLMHTEPFNIQAKAIENMGAAHKVLSEMPDDGNMNLVFHKKNRLGVVVSMTEEDFWILAKDAGYIKDENSCN
jgi:translation elongation factor EF-Ts